MGLSQAYKRRGGVGGGVIGWLTLCMCVGVSKEMLTEIRNELLESSVKLIDCGMMEKR